ncbi:hypothetical protein [Vibrio sp. J383]|uniref:hypothetical protein n=1 Tax=Vibrio sp. J383 TaxID=2942997 RepID=UPI0020BDEA7B|nr:hypothetical protein [Vibrio sp. J383]UQV21190.1 hypothetical protein M4S28_14890 [Vibrio sp. J383]
MQKHQGYDRCEEKLEQILLRNYAVNIQTGLETRFGALESPRRAVRTLSSFLDFIIAQDIVIEHCEELSLLFHSYQHLMMSENQHLSPTTIESDLNALRYTLEALQSSKVFPNGHLAPVMKQYNDALYKNAEHDGRKVLGGLQLPNESTDNKIPLAVRLNVPADEFLESLVSNIRRHRNTLLHIARSYLEEANARLDYREFAINFTPKAMFDNPKNLTLGVSQKNAQYSLFNDKRLGEVAKMNMISYLHHKHSGILNDDFNGRFYLYSFGGTVELREYFGLSSLSAVAAQIIIVIESGINVTNLRSMKVDANGGLKDSFRKTDDGFNIIHEKLRAGSKRNKQMVLVDDSYINIEYAFDYLLRSTEHYRKFVIPEDKDYLFIHDTMQVEGTVCRMSDFPFKHGFKSLLKVARDKILNDPQWCEQVTVKDIDDLLLHEPNAQQLRVSEGILRWYDSGGDSLAAASYLGNSESVALKNYIPKELQGVLFSHQISKFQHLLLAAATDKQTYQAEVLGLQSQSGANDYYEDYITQLDAMNPHWRKLAESKEIKLKKNNEKAFALIMNEATLLNLYTAFNNENKALKDGNSPDEETSLRSTVFKNLVSYINGYGKGEQRRMLQKIILSGRGS